MSELNGSQIQTGTIPASALESVPGDMLKATYDSNASGVVDSAEAVAWNNVTSKPSTFPPDESLLTGYVAAAQKDVPNNTKDYLVLGAVADVRAVFLNYTIERGGDYEMGQLFIMTDGSSAELAPMPYFQPTFTAAAAGVTFDADIDSGNLRIGITVDNSGDTAKVQFTRSLMAPAS